MNTQPFPNNKKDAVQFITELAEKFDISINDIKTATKENKPSESAKKWVNILFGYLGAAFIFGGLCLLTEMIWPDLSSPARVTVSYGAGLCAFAMGFVFDKDQRYNHLSFPFHLISAFILPLGMFVFLNEYAKGDDTQLAIIIVFAILTAQFALPLLKQPKPSILFFAYVFFNCSVMTLLERLHVPHEFIGLAGGISMIAFALRCEQSNHRSISLFWQLVGIGFFLSGAASLLNNFHISSQLAGTILGATTITLGYHYHHQTRHEKISPLFYIIGSFGLFWSLFDLVENVMYLDISYLFVSVTLMVASVKIKSRSLLTTSTIATIGFIGYYTNEYFVDVIGWPIALIVFGFVLIGISRYALKLGKQIKSEPA